MSLGARSLKPSTAAWCCLLRCRARSPGASHRLAGSDRTTRTPSTAARRQLARPVLPQARTDEGLGAVEEALFDLDTDGNERASCPARRSVRADLRIARNPRLAVDAQRLFAARHEEDQADVRVRQQIEHAVQPFVARAFGDDESPIVEDLDEAGGIALGRHVASSVAPRGGEQEERRACDERRVCSSSDERSF